MKNNFVSLFLGSLFVFTMPSLHAMDDLDGYADDAGSEGDHDALISAIRALDPELQQALELSSKGKYDAAAYIFAKYSAAKRSQWPMLCQKIAVEALEKSINKMRFVKENRHFTKKIVDKEVNTRVGSRYAVVRLKKAQPFNNVTNKTNADE